MISFSHMLSSPRIGGGACSRTSRTANKGNRHPAMIELLRPNNELVALTKIDLDRYGEIWCVTFHHRRQYCFYLYFVKIRIND